MRALLVLLSMVFLFLLIRTRTDFQINFNDLNRNLNPLLLGYGALFAAGIVMAEVLRPLMSHLQPVLRFVVIIALVSVVWLGIDRARALGLVPSAFFQPTGGSKSGEPEGITLQIAPAWDGVFRAVADINSQAVPVLLAPGTPLVILKYSEAERLGLMPETLVFRDRIQILDRSLQAAKLTLKSIHLDGIEVFDVPAAIAARGAVETSILGLSYFERLDHVQLSGQEMILHQSAR